jgi:integrase/recombinase XerD
MDDTQLVVKGERALTSAQFQALAEVPPEIEWFANITNPRTRAAYEVDVKAFARFVGIRAPEECRSVTRAHVIAWRKDLEGRRAGRVLNSTKAFRFVFVL